jgi:hypothetical protein
VGAVPISGILDQPALLLRLRTEHPAALTIRRFRDTSTALSHGVRAGGAMLELVRAMAREPARTGGDT